MKLFLLLIPFMCITEQWPCPAKKIATIQKKEVKSVYQFPSALIISLN